jgi:flagellar motor component MotA
LEGKMARTPNLDNVSTRLQRIAQLAREDRKRSFVSLAHHIDKEFLREAYRLTRKDGAPGVDGQTAAEYEANLEENLQSLLVLAAEKKRRILAIIAVCSQSHAATRTVRPAGRAGRGGSHSWRLVEVSGLGLAPS